MKLKLKAPSIKYKQTFCDYVNDYIRAKEDFYVKYYNDALVDFDKYLLSLKNYEKGFNLTPNGTPYFTYWFVNQKDEIVGVSRLRTKLNDWTEKAIGHIGFDVKPIERKKGYASQILSLTIEEAKKIGLKELLLICDFDNTASKKVIEVNGGIFKDEITSLLNGNKAFRYDIYL